MHIIPHIGSPGKRIQANKRNPCIACGSTRRCYVWDSHYEPDRLGCHNSDDAPAGYFKSKKNFAETRSVFIKNQEREALTPAQQHERELARIAREETARDAKAKEIRGLLPAADRDIALRRLAAELGLITAHRQSLLARGLSADQIQSGLFFSIAQYQKVPNWVPLNFPGCYVGKFGDRQISGKISGIAIVTINRQGLATGYQIANDDRSEGKKYVWPGGFSCAGRAHLPTGGTSELPIQVAMSNPESTEIWLVEGTLKPVVAAHRHGINTVGASGGSFASSPIQVANALAGTDSVIIAIDGGDIINPDRIRHWINQNAYLESIGKIVEIAWYGQFGKGKGKDIDEVGSLDGIQKITFADWLELSEKALARQAELDAYRALSTTTAAAAETRNEPMLGQVMIPRPGSIQYISSPVATGKTKQLAATIEAWTRTHAEGRIFMLGYRNGLLDNAGERLGIPSYRVGNGQDDFAIANYPKLRMCLDSVLRLKIEDVAPGSLIILDEIEAILEHGAAGGTLGLNAPAIQAHLLQIMHQVLRNNGAIIGLEDSITDLSINGLGNLLGDQYPIELVVNTAERFNWDVRIGHGTTPQKIAHILELLAAGETIAAPTSSRRFGQVLERAVLAKMPELEGRIALLDSYAHDKQDLKSNPDQWLAENQTRLLIYTSAVESGFSIEQYKFDRVVASFANLTTRTHMQMLSRVRSDCPRDIFCSKRSAEAASVKLVDPEKILKLEKTLAGKTSLAQGEGRIENSAEGAAWNLLIAQFKARANLSYKNSQDLLKINLESRGHQVAEIAWKEVVEVDSELPRELRDLQQLIEAEENHVLHEANGFAITPAQAISALHSSDTTFEQKKQAEKCLLHDRLPGVEFSENFLAVAVTHKRSAYLKACVLNFMIDHPALAYQLDRDAYTAQKTQPHIIYSRVPRLSQKVSAMKLIATKIKELIASDTHYDNSTDEVLAIAQLAQQNSYDLWALLGINARPAVVDGAGRLRNTPITIANRLLKKLGYKTEVASDTIRNGERVKLYRIANANCSHRATIEQGLLNKYAEKMAAINADTATKIEKENEQKLGESNNMAKFKYSQPDSSHPEPLQDLIAIRNCLAIAIDGATTQERREIIAEAKSVWGGQSVDAAAKMLSFDDRLLYREAA